MPPVPQRERYAPSAVLLCTVFLLLSSGQVRACLVCRFHTTAGRMAFVQRLPSDQSASFSTARVDTTTTSPSAVSPTTSQSGVPVMLFGDAVTFRGPAYMGHGSYHRTVLTAQGNIVDEDKSGDNPDEIESPDSNEQSDDPPLSTAMIASIGFYKNFISPLLPPACRFLPTCSQYGVQAIQEFGPWKGGVLTAWRIARCSPFGGRGYDPPVWPPVWYTYSSY